MVLVEVVVLKLVSVAGASPVLDLSDTHSSTWCISPGVIVAGTTREVDVSEDTPNIVDAVMATVEARPVAMQEQTEDTTRATFPTIAMSHSAQIHT